MVTGSFYLRRSGPRVIVGSSAQPLARVVPQLHPRAVGRHIPCRPAHLHIAEHALGVRHHRGEAAIGGGHCCQAARAAVGVVGIGFGGFAVVVGEAHGGDGF